MPTIIAEELAEGAMYSTSFDKTIAIRVWLVRVEGTTTPSFMAYAAANFDGIPIRGQYHPTLDALVCQKISSKPKQNKPTVWVTTAEYGAELDKSRQTPSRTGPCTLEYGTATANLKVFQGWTKDGSYGPMILHFNDPNKVQASAVDLIAAGALTIPVSTTRDQPCEVDIQVPMPLVTLRRNEPADGFDYVKFKTEVEGHINAIPFMGKPARTWLCVKIDVQLRNDSFDSAYTFQYHGHIEPFEWNPIFVFKEYTGKGTGKNSPGAPAQDVSFENGGIQQFRVYPQCDFNQIGLGRF